MRQKLTLLSDAAVVLVALAFGYTLVRNSLLGPTSGAGESVKAGDQLPVLGAAPWGRHDRTLVLALKKGCHFCEDSAPFYKRLSAGPTDTRLVAVFPDDAAEAKQVTQAEELDIETVSGFPLKRLKVAGTPTVILADAHGAS